jgi:hypothetical protein
VRIFGSVALPTMVDAAIAHPPADGIAVGTVPGDTAGFVCPGRRLCLNRNGVGDDAGDVVGCAVCVGEVDQLPGSLLRLGGHAQCRVQRTAVDDGGQSLGAEQLAIAGGDPPAAHSARDGESRSQGHAARVAMSRSLPGPCKSLRGSFCAAPT